MMSAIPPNASIEDLLHAAIRERRRVRVRLEDGRSTHQSARVFVGVPTAIGPWGGAGEPHVLIQMVGARGTIVAVAVALTRVVAVDHVAR
jgi:hypothetical protein